MNIPTTTLPLNALTPHPENYNTHPASQIKELAESLSTFGQFGLFGSVSPLVALNTKRSYVKPLVSVIGFVMIFFGLMVAILAGLGRYMWKITKPNCISYSITGLYLVPVIFFPLLSVLFALLALAMFAIPGFSILTTGLLREAILTTGRQSIPAFTSFIKVFKRLGVGHLALRIGANLEKLPTFLDMMTLHPGVVIAELRLNQYHSFTIWIRAGLSWSYSWHLVT